MPVPELEDAQARYAIARARVDLLLAEFLRALQAHEAVRPIDRARVDDLEQVEVDLARVVELLKAK